MATITLYASRVNLMPSVFGTLRNTVSSFNGGIDLLRQGALGIDSSICDLEDIISSLRSSSDTQEAIEEFLDDIQDAAEEFIDEVAEIDEEVSELIATAEEDFYSLYDYLRPEDESWLDAIGDFFTDLLSDAWDYIAGLCMSATEWIRANRDDVADFLHELVDYGEQIIGYAEDFLNDHPWIGEFFSFLGDAAGFIYDNVLSPLGDLASYIYNNTPLHYLGDYLYDRFEDFATRFISKLGQLIATEEFGWVVDKVITLLGPALEIGKIWTTEKLPGAEFIVGLIGAVDPDGDGIYHIKQDWWQSWGPMGYNVGYDNVFYSAINANGNSIGVYRMEFTLENGETFTVWSWKGDYMNLGAGTETGIYQATGDGFHYTSATDYACDMSLSLSYQGEKLFDYSPYGDSALWQNGAQWWVDGFDSNTQNVQAVNLTSSTTINFSTMYNGDAMFDSFYDDLSTHGNVVYSGGNNVVVVDTYINPVTNENTTATWTINTETQTANLVY